MFVAGRIEERRHCVMRDVIEPDGLDKDEHSKLVCIIIGEKGV